VTFKYLFSFRLVDDQNNSHGGGFTLPDGVVPYVHRVGDFLAFADSYGRQQSGIVNRVETQYTRFGDDQMHIVVSFVLQ
jgi:hypothetical protein